MGAAEFGEPRREPERSEPLGAGELHLAGGGRQRHVLGAHQPEVGSLHAARGGEDLLALGGGAHAVDVAGHERDAELLLELGDAVAQPVDRQPELERGRAEAAVLDHLQEGVDVLPRGQQPAGPAALPSAASLQLRREKGL